MANKDWIFDRPGWWRLQQGEAVLGYVGRVGNGWRIFRADRRTEVGHQAFDSIAEAMSALARRVTH